MNAHSEFRPDLDECSLEDRTLPAAPGLSIPQFIPSSGSTPSFVVPGFSQGGSPGGSGGVNYPGPSFFYMPVGLSNGGGNGLRLGGTQSVYTGTPLTVPGSVPVGSGASESSGGGGGRSFSGYAASVSSGYNFALGSQNAFGMSGTAVGSVSAHVYGTADVPQTPAANDADAASRNAAANATPTTPNAVPNHASQGVDPSAGHNLLRKSP